MGDNRDSRWPRHRQCMNPELAKKFNIDFWYNTEDGQHYSLPGNHGLLPTTSGYPPRPVSPLCRSALTISTSRSLSQL